jgi:hypothetical protein
MIYVIIILGTIINTVIFDLSVEFISSDNEWIGAIIAVTFTLLLVPWGLLSGWLWRKNGEFLYRRIVIGTLSKLQPSTAITSPWFERIAKYCFGGRHNQFFVQLETEDVKLTRIRGIYRSSRKTLILFIAIQTTLLNWIADDVIRYFDRFASIEESYALTFFVFFALSLTILAVYLPFSLLLDDTRLMVIHTNGTIKFTLSRIRNFIDGFFSVTGIISGYFLIDQLVELDTLVSDQFEFLLPLIIFGIFLIIVLVSMILAIPILFPALYVFYRKNYYSKMVNDFREEILTYKIPLATTSIILTTERN